MLSQTRWNLSSSDKRQGPWVKPFGCRTFRDFFTHVDDSSISAILQVPSHLDSFSNKIGPLFRTARSIWSCPSNVYALVKYFLRSYTVAGELVVATLCRVLSTTHSRSEGVDVANNIQTMAFMQSSRVQAAFAGTTCHKFELAQNTRHGTMLARRIWDGNTTSAAIIRWLCRF